MSGLDALLLVIVGASALLGLMRGFVGGVASIAAWLLGGWAALRLGGDVARLLADAEPDAMHLLMGYGACFVAVSLGVAAVAWAAPEDLPTYYLTPDALRVIAAARERLFPG